MSRRLKTMLAFSCRTSSHSVPPPPTPFPPGFRNVSSDLLRNEASRSSTAVDNVLRRYSSSVGGGEKDFLTRSPTPSSHRLHTDAGYYTSDLVSGTAWSRCVVPHACLQTFALAWGSRLAGRTNKRRNERRPASERRGDPREKRVVSAARGQGD